VRGRVRAATCFFLRDQIAICYNEGSAGRCDVVNLALKLNVLAVFAVFVFVAAILLGAF
jgi:hypothetical protein